MSDTETTIQKATSALGALQAAVAAIQQKKAEEAAAAAAMKKAKAEADRAAAAAAKAAKTPEPRKIEERREERRDERGDRRSRHPVDVEVIPVIQRAVGARVTLAKLPQGTTVCDLLLHLEDDPLRKEFESFSKEACVEAVLDGIFDRMLSVNPRAVAKYYTDLATESLNDLNARELPYSVTELLLKAGVVEIISNEEAARLQGDEQTWRGHRKSVEGKEEHYSKTCPECRKPIKAFPTKKASGPNSDLVLHFTVLGNDGPLADYAEFTHKCLMDWRRRVYDRVAMRVDFYHAFAEHIAWAKKDRNHPEGCYKCRWPSYLDVLEKSGLTLADIATAACPGKAITAWVNRDKPCRTKNQRTGMIYDNFGPFVVYLLSEDDVVKRGIAVPSGMAAIEVWVPDQDISRMYWSLKDFSGGIYLFSTIDPEGQPFAYLTDVTDPNEKRSAGRLQTILLCAMGKDKEQEKPMEEKATEGAAAKTPTEFQIPQLRRGREDRRPVNREPFKNGTRRDMPREASRRRDNNPRNRGY